MTVYTFLPAPSPPNCRTEAKYQCPYHLLRRSAVANRSANTFWVCSSGIKAGLSLHGNSDAGLAGELDGLGVAGVGVARDPDAGVVGQHALDARGHLFAAVGDGHLPGVLRVADAYAAAVVDGDPGGAAGGVQQGVQQGPVGDGVGAIEHLFGFAVRRSHRAAVQMVAADDNRRLQLAPGHQLVERQAEFRPLAVAQPANARRETLEAHALLRQADPAVEDRVVREELQHQFVGAIDVRRLTRERHPAERPAALAEKRPDVRWHEAGKIVGVLDALLESKRADVVAVVKRDCAQLLQREHPADVLGNRFHGAIAVLLRVAPAQLGSL